MARRIYTILGLLLISCGVVFADASRSERLIDSGWRFCLGNAADFADDFYAGTEYFNYLTKAASIHNEGPYAVDFDASEWAVVDLPHDWVVDLEYSAEASHSHGYKCVGWRYPESSVGWYRRELVIPATSQATHYELRFDGIFRAADVWFNGFWLGNEPSGYATQIYDITDYVRHAEKNVITVRVDATLEEGWFYEGAGIYRHVWLTTTSPLHIATHGTAVATTLRGEVQITTEVVNDGGTEQEYALRHRILDVSGRVVAEGAVRRCDRLLPRECGVEAATLKINKPQLWSPDEPYLYRLVSEVVVDGVVIDSYVTRFGVREVTFSPECGMMLNGSVVKLRGVNLHQDHAGVGAAIPDALNEYRLQRLKELGCNAIRTSHNPATPALLDLCDSMGFMVVEENRLMGINTEHIALLERMIRRDRNHPSIIAWSVGNEEWGIEGKECGEQIARTMTDYCHIIDPTRVTTVGVSGGRNIARGVDVVGYNYFVQNDVDAEMARYADRVAMGSEETSGCGTRGVYFDSERDKGRMPSFNRTGFNGDTTVMNVIGRGWRFYEERPHLAGLFYWTGFDYRGEPNPLKYPATGSQFGIMDYCGFAKDEFYYLKALWCDEPSLHLLPHWNLAGHEGEEVEVWAYTNCDEVELFVNGESMGQQRIERGDYGRWRVIYTPGELSAVGYRNGEATYLALHNTVATANSVELREARLQRDDCRVVDIRLMCDGAFVPTACDRLRVAVADGVEIVGWGNGDSAFKHRERPSRGDKEFIIEAFNGCAQLILRGAGDISVEIVQ